MRSPQYTGGYNNPLSLSDEHGHKEKELLGRKKVVEDIFILFLFLGFVPAQIRRNALELPRPGSWDLGPPRVVNTLARSLLVPLSGNDHEPTTGSQ